MRVATFRIIEGDAVAGLRSVQNKSAQMCVTSPPYFGLRSYGTNPQVWGGDSGCQHEWGDSIRAPWANSVPGPNTGGKNDGRRNSTKESGNLCQACGAWRGELGLEPTPELYIEHLVEVFSEIRRVLRDDGTLWVNIGDSYASGKGSCFNPGGGANSLGRGRKEAGAHPLNRGNKSTLAKSGLKPKDLIGIPWMLAFALRADGWYLRSDIIWHKPNPMPESVTDRPTKAHEYLFLLSKGAKYFYDAEAIKEPVSGDPDAPRNRWDTKDYLVPGQKPQKRLSRSGNKERKYGESCDRPGSHLGRGIPWEGANRNKRSVWTVATKAYREAHFATFPTELITPCILAGSKEGDTVVDPFCGSGTTGVVALRHNRNFVGCELKPDYVQMTRNRILGDAPMFNREESAA